MEESILRTTKKILGLAPEYTEFDLDIITHINAAFSTLSQIGVIDGFFVETDAEKWSDLEIDNSWLSQVRTYIYLKVRLIFDPPATSFVLESMNKQIAEAEWRLNVFREDAIQ